MNGFCVGGQRRSGTISIEDEKTKTGHKLLVGRFVQCNITKSMIVCDNAIKAERLVNFFESIGKVPARVVKKVATNATKKPRRAPENGTKIRVAAVGRNSNSIPATSLDAINFYHT